MKKRMYGLWLIGLLFTLVGCGEDEYEYPPVKLEFVTVCADAKGQLETLIPDQGKRWKVVEDRTHSIIGSFEARRVVSNYETVTDGARIYSLQPVLTPWPKPETDEAFKDGIKTDPVEVRSIWMGRDFLNIVLNVKVTPNKGHAFGIVEDTQEWKEKGIVKLLLYHHANQDEMLYNRKVYLSVPLRKYIDPSQPQQAIQIQFTYGTLGEDQTTVLSDKYAKPGFVYTPSETSK